MAECLSAIGISTLTTTVMVIAWRRPKPVFLAPWTLLAGGLGTVANLLHTGCGAAKRMMTRQW